MTADPPPELSPAARRLIERLDLEPHPEGGYYRQTHKSDIRLPRDALPGGYPGDRAVCTCILFLLPAGARSRPHRVRSEELWLHHAGDDLCLGLSPALDDDGSTTDQLTLGSGPDARFQAVVPPGHWQEAEPLPGPHGYTLCACVVAPGFEFEDFEMAGDEKH